MEISLIEIELQLIHFHEEELRRDEMRAINLSWEISSYFLNLLGQSARSKALYYDF